MRFKKKRKSRTTGEDLCPGCYSYNCDPMTMSKKFYDKIDKRIEKGLCPSCGNNPCTCKYSMSDYSKKNIEYWK